MYYGDFNARTADDLEYIPSDNNDKFVGDFATIDGIDISTFLIRSNEDQIINNFGKRLLQICMNIDWSCNR